jgi:phage-related protein
MAEKIKGLTVKLGFDNSEFKKKMKEADKDIRATENQVKALQKSLELKWDSAKFAEAQKMAQNAITKTDDKVKELRAEMAKLSEKGFSADSSSFINLQTEITKTEDKAERLRNQIQQLNEMKVTRLADSIKNIGDTITKAGQALIPFSAAAASVLAGMTAIGKSTINAATEIDDMSQMVNMNAEALQKWRYIAMQLGLDNTVLQNALTKTQAAFADLSVGEITPAADALAMLGISTEQAAQGMDANFELMILKLSEVTDSTTQAYLANELFGDRLGSKIIPLLNGGASGLKDLNAEFEALGYLTNEDIASLAEFDDALNRTKYAFANIKNEVGVALLPVMETFNQIIVEKIIPAVQQLASWFSNLSDSQKNILVSILAVVATLAPVLIIIGSLTNGVGSLIGVVMKLYTALAAVSAIPIVLIIGAVVGLLAILYNSNEKFRESINRLIGVLGGALAPILDLVMSLFNSLLQSLMPIITMIGDVLAPVITMLATILNPIIQLIGIRLIPMMKSLEFMFKIIQISMLPLMGLLSLLGKGLTWFSDVMSDVFDWVIDKMNKVLKAIEFMINKSIDLINGLIRGINNLGGWLGISLSELDKVKMQIETSSTINTKQTITTTPSTHNNQVKEAIGGVPGTISNSTVNYSNDHSTKNVTIEVTVQNYAAEVDVDKMVQDIQIKLAEAY